MCGIQDYQKLESVPAVSPLTGIERKKVAKAAYYQANKEKIAANYQSYYQANKEKIAARGRLYYQANKYKKKEYQAEYYHANRDKIAASKSRAAVKLVWRTVNKEKLHAYGAAYRAANREKVAAAHRKYQKSPIGREKIKEINRKRRGTLKGNLSNRMGSYIRRALRDNKNRIHWEALVNYTIAELKTHLEKLFTEGMTWDAFLTGEIHIDHKIPVSVFNYELPTDIDFKRCWALKNLQPMWARENMIKGDKLENDFQPSLKGV